MDQTGAPFARGHDDDKAAVRTLANGIERVHCVKDHEQSTHQGHKALALCFTGLLVPQACRKLRQSVGQGTSGNRYNVIRDGDP